MSDTALKDINTLTVYISVIYALMEFRFRIYSGTISLTATYKYIKESVICKCIILCIIIISVFRAGAAYRCIELVS